jgi:uncharacterized protein YfaS (alpha-2-macroglobulin family)
MATCWAFDQEKSNVKVDFHEDQVLPLFEQTAPANTATELLLDHDNRMVVGWVTGPENYAGTDATIRFGDGREDVVQVEDDNTFQWNFPDDTSGKVQVQITENIQSQLNIQRTPRGSGICYYVIDRSAYRPGQTINFVGFLRTETAGGKFVPAANQKVQATIVSVGKQTTAATLELTSDEFGRVEGDYQFSQADALGEYTLRIGGFPGTAQFKLAEFRKAKVRLKIDSELDDRNLKLKFQAVDFLDKGVPGSDIRFDAKVVYVGDRPESLTLNPDQFAYSAGLQDSGPIFSFSDANEDEKLLHEFGSLSVPVAKMPPPVAAEMNGEVTVNSDGSAEHTIQLTRQWLSGGYVISIEGTLTDYNGREQRASRTIPISSKVSACDLELSLDKRHFAIGEKIKLNLAPEFEGKPTKAIGAVSVMRLSPQPFGNPYAMGSYGYGYNDLYINNYSYMHRGANFRSNYIPRLRYRKDFSFESSKRTLVDTELISNNCAEIEIDEPGAYQLICMVQLPDGSKLKNEIGCVVDEPQKLPNLLVHLDEKEFQSNQGLKGWIHSRVGNATAMLTLRDALGIRLRKLIQLERGLARIDLPFPDAMKYGATVEVEFLHDDELYFNNQFIRVLPVDKLFEVAINTQEVYKPGDPVQIDLQVNREEEMDLVVSVFDQSLLGIATDRSPDVQSFFLADQRVRWRTNSRAVARKLDGVTVIELIKTAEKIINESGQQVGYHELGTLVAAYREHNYLYAHQLVQLLNAAGYPAKVDNSTSYYGNSWMRVDHEKEKTSPISVYDALQSLGRGLNQQVLLQLKGDEIHCTSAIAQNHQLAMNYGNALMNGGYGMQSARGDARFSVTGNAVFSHSVSGQAMRSHVPVSQSAPAQTLGAESTVSIRKNFSDAAFWNAKIRTDKNGKASINFKLPDSLTNWQVVVTAISPKMHVGQSKKSFRTYKPIMVWPMLPRSFVQGDVVDVYASVHNRSETTQTIQVSLETENGKVLSESTKSVKVEPNQNTPVYWKFQAGQDGFAQLLMTAKCDEGSDASLKRLPVYPMVATQWITSSGFVSKGGELDIPDSVDLTNAELEVTIVPSLLADTLESLEYLVEYPHGCVEQTMSRFLPAIAVKGVLDHAKVNNEALEQKLPLVVEAGIKRLLELQNSDGGWGWHGGSQTHEMMTPYALYGLVRAREAGYKIPNQQAIQRGTNRLNTFIHAMNTLDHVSDRIYCMYVYSHLTEKLPANWYDYLGVLLDGKLANGAQADQKQKVDSMVVEELRKATLSDYALALALEISVRGESQNLADRLARELRSRARGGKHSAFWTTANFSRWGNDRFEITAAALKALVAYDADDPTIARILNFLTSTKRGNKWNSTKDTAMILYGICDYLSSQPVSKKNKGQCELIVGDWSKSFELAGQTLKVSVPIKQITTGKNHLKFVDALPGSMFRAVLTYRQQGKDIVADSNGVKITREFFLLSKSGQVERKLKSGDTVPRGSYIQSLVTAEHLSNDRMEYVLIENPKPSSCEILPATDKRFPQESARHELREDKTEGVNYHHMRVGKKLVDRCVLHAELTGTFLVPPAKVELMYNTLERGHTNGFLLKVN